MGKKKGKKKNKGPTLPHELFQKLLQYVSFREISVPIPGDIDQKIEKKKITSEDITKLIELEDPSAEEPKERDASSQTALVCGFEKSGKFKGKPLKRAVQLGNLEICKVLINHNAEVFTDHLTDAIKLKNFEVCKYLLDTNERVEKILHAQDSLLVSITPPIPTPHHAALMGDAKIMQLILDKDLARNCNITISEKADVNAGRTPLHMAAEKGHVDVLKTLLHWAKLKVSGANGGLWELEAYVNVDQQDKDGKTGCTALGVASETGMVEAVKTLVVDGGLAKLRWMCSRLGDSLALKNFQDQKIVLNQGLTPVQWAAYRGDYAMTEFLVAHGMDYDIDDVRASWFPEIPSMKEPDLRACMEDQFSPQLIQRMSKAVFRGERTWKERKQRREAILRYLRVQDGLKESKFCSYICMVVAAYDVCYCDEDLISCKQEELKAKLEEKKKKRRKRLAEEAEKEREEAERAEAERQRAANAAAAKKKKEAAKANKS
mmetsp:Transcript_10020/g.16163  ORF Transcript_10020/g.16163 Transcript_10020/m.16163 type:complete len:490 (+) Transcript_10020:103-1572(+)